jgi:hypothetical protein
MPLARLPFWLLAALTAALIAAPLYLVDVVPLLDYPAHLTRVTLLSQLPPDPLVARAYTVDIRPLANLAMDIAVPLMAPLTGAALGLKLFITLGLAAWIAGAALLYRGLWREWSAQPLAAAFFALNPSFFDGYFNFHFACGLALIGGGLWLICRHGAAFLAAMATLAVVLLFSHLMAVAILGLLIGALEIGRWRQTGAGPAALAAALVKVGLVFVPAGLLWAFVLEHGPGGAIAYNWPANLAGLGLYSSQFAGLRFNALPMLALAAACIWAWRRKRLALAPVALPAVALFLVAALLMPSEALGGAGIHVRLPAVIGVLAVVAVRIDLPARFRPLAAALLIAVLALGNAVQSARWIADADVIERARAAIRAHVPEGARMAEIIGGKADERFWHVVDLAVLDRKTSVAALFTTPGQSTVRLNPAYAPFSATNAIDGANLTFAIAAALLGPTPPPPGDPALAERYRPYRDMPCDFDYLLLMGRPPADIARPASLIAVAGDADFSLYRIAPPPERGCAPR